MNEQRNTIFIALLVVFVLVAGMITLKKMKNNHLVVTRKEKQLDARERETSETAKMLDKIKEEYDELNFRWQSAPKKILNLPEPALTVSYIVWMIETYKLDIDFDFSLESMAMTNTIANFVFLLNGNAEYESLYKFIYYLTVNPLLYTITELDFFRAEDPEKITFSMRITGFFMQGDENNDVTKKFEFASIRPSNREQNFFDIFESRTPVVKKVQKTSVAKKVSNLLDAEHASLVAMTSKKAYFLDANGKMYKLSPGDAVMGGKLMHLNLRTSQAIFVLHGAGAKQVIIGLDTPFKAERQE